MGVLALGGASSFTQIGLPASANVPLTIGAVCGRGGSLSFFDWDNSAPLAAVQPPVRTGGMKPVLIDRSIEEVPPLPSKVVAISNLNHSTQKSMQ